MEGHAALAVISIGFVAGALWQTLDRRDLADRLLVFVVLLFAGALFLLFIPTGYLAANAGPGHVLLGIVGGLVCGEQAARLRRRRAPNVDHSSA